MLLIQVSNKFFDQSEEVASHQTNEYFFNEYHIKENLWAIDCESSSSQNVYISTHYF